MCGIYGKIYYEPSRTAAYCPGHWQLEWRRPGGRLSCMHLTPHTWQEARRLQTWHLKPQGGPQHQMAAALGGSAGAGSQGKARARDGCLPRNSPAGGSRP
jgi:hypothetical protein